LEKLKFVSKVKWIRKSAFGGVPKITPKKPSKPLTRFVVLLEEHLSSVRAWGHFRECGAFQTIPHISSFKMNVSHLFIYFSMTFNLAMNLRCVSLVV
jgi:hypothetical protein